MREIKFRAWDKESKKFFTPTYEAYKGKLEALFINLRGRLCIQNMSGIDDESMFPDRFILIQFTGLKDKQGVEIYEGDIVKYELFGGLVAIYEIYWSVDYCSFCFKPTSPYTNVSLEKDKASNFEVIGNIYENEDLLQQNNPHT